MWLILAFLSAALLGFYDSFKKKSLTGNAVIPVLFLNTVFSSLIFLPFIIISMMSHQLDGSIFHVPCIGWETHKYIILKSIILLSSWALGYIGLKHLPLTIVGPINATRPVITINKDVTTNKKSFCIFAAKIIKQLQIWEKFYA